MPVTKADIIAQLRKDILSWERGGKMRCDIGATVTGLGAMKEAFPNNTFPISAVHEFCSGSAEESAATGGFVSGILSSVMHKGGVCLWITAFRTIFPPALSLFGVPPERVIFISLQKEKEILWAMEEALKCEGLAAVVSEIRELNFTASRRLQLAVEQSGVTGFVLRHNPRNINTTACVSRWKITPLPSVLRDGIPGVGFPRWKVSLLKIRNGKPGSWNIEYAAGGFRHIPAISVIPQQQRKKTG